jgi:membrane protease YdiL (CAAX protease family)
LATAWVPLAYPLSLALQRDPNQETIATMGLLAILFIVGQVLWGRWIYDRPNLLADYGLRWQRTNGVHLLQGLALGWWTLILLFGVETLLGLATWTPPQLPLWRLLGEGLLSGLGVGLGEEICFRGWLLGELQQDYGPRRAALWSAIIFMMLHFLKPIQISPRFLFEATGLILLGLVLAWAKQSRGDRLGIAIGLHGSLVSGYYWVQVGEMVTYPRPELAWLTGFGGAPIAGLLGLLGLGGLALWFWRQRPPAVVPALPED